MANLHLRGNTKWRTWDLRAPRTMFDLTPDWTQVRVILLSGSTGERVAVVTASARSLPALRYSIDEDMLASMTCTCPPSRSTSAGPAPR